MNAPSDTAVLPMESDAAAMTTSPNWPADHVERRAISTLAPYARNARTHSDAQVAQIAASMRTWGWTNPVLIDEAGGIIAGHGRVLAAQSLGIKDVPVMVAQGWSEQQKRAYILADNQLALNAGWDEVLLGDELRDLDASGFELDLIGFADIDRLLAGKTAGLSDPDDVPDVPDELISVLGDVWLMGKHRLVCGDSTDAATVAICLGGATPHLMVTDPPYGVDYDPAWRNASGASTTRRTGKVLNDDRADWREAWALFPGEVAYVWHGALHATTVAESLGAAGFQVRSQIIWAKERLVLSRGDYHWQHEPCWYAVRAKGKGHWSGDRKQTTLRHIASRHQDAETVHGTQKPVACMRRPIENNSFAGQAIYEPFSGSGTCIIAAEISGRICHAIELSPAYVDVAILRWQAFSGMDAVLESDGATFGAVAAARRATEV